MLPPGLDVAPPLPASKPASRQPSCGSSDETQMRDLVRACDHAGALAILSASEYTNARMANMALTSLIASGASVDAAATEVLRTCARCNIRPVRAAPRARAPHTAIAHRISDALRVRCPLCSCRDQTREIFNNILGALSKQASPGEVQIWVTRMRDAGIRPDTWACNILLKSMLQAGEWSSAATLLSGMTSEHASTMTAAAAAVMDHMAESSDPTSGSASPTGSSRSSDASEDPHRLPPVDAVSFNTAISALGAAHKPQQAESVLCHMLGAGFGADRTSFTAVISAFARAQRPADAARVLEKMVASKVPPDTVAVNTVLSAYAHIADCEGAQRMLTLFEESARGGVLPNGTAPDLISYNTVLLACANATKPPKAEETFAALLARGLVPSQVSYSTVLSAHARAGNVTAAQAWLDKMIAHGITPDAVSYNGVCSAHARVGDAAAALACLRRMESDAIAVTPTTHAIVINAFVKSGDLDAAERSLRALVSSGESLTAASFNSLISAHAKARRPQRAEATFAMMEQARVTPTLITFNSLASAHAASSDLPAVEGVLRRLTAARLLPDRYTYGALLQACSRGGSGTVNRQRAQLHAEALLTSAVPLNDYLTTLCKRVVGEASFAQLQHRHRPVANVKSTQQRVPKRPAADSPETKPTTPSSPEAMYQDVRMRLDANLSQEAAETAGTGATGGGDGDGDGEDGWTVSSSRRRRCRQGAPPASPCSSVSPHSSIKKTSWRPPVSRTQATLVVANPADGETGGDGKLPPFRLVGLPLRRSKSSVDASVLRDVLLTTALPLARSAASELALSLGQEMKLE